MNICVRCKTKIKWYQLGRTDCHNRPYHQKCWGSYSTFDRNCLS